jgi:hypothetical protein
MCRFGGSVPELVWTVTDGRRRPDGFPFRPFHQPTASGSLTDARARRARQARTAVPSGGQAHHFGGGVAPAQSLPVRGLCPLGPRRADARLAGSLPSFGPGGPPLGNVSTRATPTAGNPRGLLVTPAGGRNPVSAWPLFVRDKRLARSLPGWGPPPPTPPDSRTIRSRRCD